MNIEFYFSCISFIYIKKVRPKSIWWIKWVTVFVQTYLWQEINSKTIWKQRSVMWVLKEMKKQPCIRTQSQAPSSHTHSNCLSTSFFLCNRETIYGISTSFEKSGAIYEARFITNNLHKSNKHLQYVLLSFFKVYLILILEYCVLIYMYLY